MRLSSGAITRPRSRHARRRAAMLPERKLLRKAAEAMARAAVVASLRGWRRPEGFWTRLLHWIPSVCKGTLPWGTCLAA